MTGFGEVLLLLAPSILYFTIVGWAIVKKTELAKKVLIALGILMLPFPPIGLPVLITGIVQLRSLRKRKEELAA